MKKIIYVINDISIIGGRERMLIQKYLKLKSEYEIKIISRYFTNEKFKNLHAELYNDIIILFPNRKKNFLLNTINYIKKLRHELKKINPDILVVFPEISMYIVPFFYIKAKKILEIHSSYSYRISNITGLKKFFFEFEKNYLLKKYEKVIVLSNIDKDKWKIKNIEVIPNFYIKKENIKIKEIFISKKFISAGRLSYEKGFDILIEIWKIIIKTNKKIKIDIYGEGPEKEKILSKIKENKLENNINMKTFTNELNKKYKEYYACILPSRFEAFPMVALESLNNALPIISFDMECGIRDMVLNGKEGFLIERYNSEKMAQKIIELYNDSELRNKLSKNALEKSKEFEENKIIYKWKQLFEKLQ